MTQLSTTPAGEGFCPYEGCEGLLALKGSLHNHTVASSGLRTPPESVRHLYQAAGYRFAALTDHDRRQHELPWTDDDYDVSEPGAFVLLRGYEATIGSDHVNCVGVRPEDLTRDPTQPGFIQEALDAGGLLHLNHPARYNSQPADVYDHPELRLVQGLEVYSGARVDRQPMAIGLWDACLRHGLRLWAFASADCHNYDPKLPDSPFNGYVVVFAAAIEQEAIMASLKAGRFYASTGVHVEHVEFAGGRLTVESRDADFVTFVGAEGRLDRVRGHRAEYEVTGREGYVRIELERDEPCFHTPGAPAKRAWLQPIWP